LPAAVGRFKADEDDEEENGDEDGDDDCKFRSVVDNGHVIIGTCIEQNKYGYKRIANLSPTQPFILLASINE